MPSYEYNCENCGHDFELMRTLDEHRRQPRPPCPKCHSKKTQQKFSVFQAVTSHKA